MHPNLACGLPYAGNGRSGGHVLVLTDHHTVWGWGGNAAGQLAVGPAMQPSAAGSTAAAIPTSTAMGLWVAAPVEAVDSVAAAALGQPTAVACGHQHSLLLCANGQVYAAGSNACGACGLPVVQLHSAAFSHVPLPAGESAAAISCGGANSAVITASGRLLVCGSNEFGQAGVGKPGGSCYILTDIGPSAAWHGMQRTNQWSGGGGGEAAAAATDVACGSGTLYALTSEGDVFSWGQGGQGALACWAAR